MQVRLSEITLAARHRLAPLTAEVAGYIVWLATAEALAEPRAVSAERIGITALGEVTLAAGDVEPALASERELRQLLSCLLGLCRSGTPALLRAAARNAIGDLEALQAELGAALIPINHAASQRALARLYRETDRARAELAGPVVIVEDEPEPIEDAPTPLVIIEDEPAPLARTSVLTQPSLELPAPSESLEPGWDALASSVLQRCDTELCAPPDAAVRDFALAFAADVGASEAVADEPPPWIEVTEWVEPPSSEVGASEPERASAAPAISGTTLRSAVAAELLEIEVQFARDTERPAPGWPSEWQSTPTPSTIEAPVTHASDEGMQTWGASELGEIAPETSPVASHRRTQPGLAPLTGLAPLAIAELDFERAEGAQTLRVTQSVSSDVMDRHRSDLAELLSRFLSDSGSDERITKELRRLMGLELEAERLSEEPPRAVGS
jgi:hypothetical protein